MQEQETGPNLGSTGGSLGNVLKRGKQQNLGGAEAFQQAEGLRGRLGYKVG